MQINLFQINQIYHLQQNSLSPLTYAIAENLAYICIHNIYNESNIYKYITYISHLQATFQTSLKPRTVS